MRIHKEQPLNQNPQPQKGHTDADKAREEDHNIHKTKEDIRQVPQPQVPDEEEIEHTSWERPQTEEDKDRVL